jgi:hypothetical protein
MLPHLFLIMCAMMLTDWVNKHKQHQRYDTTPNHAMQRTPTRCSPHTCVTTIPHPNRRPLPVGVADLVLVRRVIRRGLGKLPGKQNVTPPLLLVFLI